MRKPSVDPAGPSPRRYAHGEAILHQGDPGECLFFVLSGAVRLAAVLESGREVVVGLLGSGEVFGEVALLGGGSSPVEARAVGEARIAVLHRTSAALEEALAHDVPTRVSRRLCELARRHGVRDPGGVRLSLPLTQEDLGRMIGASREAVNKSLSALAARGLVRAEGRRYVIPDIDALEGASAFQEATA